MTGMPVSGHFSGGPLAALAGGSLARRFHRWQGVSGRSYVFSVFAADLEVLPDYADAVLLVVERGAHGARILTALETGALPSLAFAEAHRAAAAASAPEFHFHLMAETREARRALIADLTMKLLRECCWKAAA